MTDECLQDACGPVGELSPAASGSLGGEVELAVIAKALGHPMRVRIMRVLLGRRACQCGELVAELPISQATVSQHLKVLKEAGLVRGEIDGPRVCYCADGERLERLAALLETVLQPEPTTDREVVASC